MQLEQMRLLGLPVLEAQLKVHNKLLDSAFKILRTNKLSARIAISVITDQDEESSSLFHFPDPGTIPHELNKFLTDYSNRLVAERWIIETAIEELKQNLSWYSLTNNCMN